MIDILIRVEGTSLKGKFSFLFLVPLLFSQSVLWSEEEADQSVQEAEIHSLFPLGGNPGASFPVQVRGRGLEDAYAVWVQTDAVVARIKQVSSIDLNPRQSYDGQKDKKKKEGQLVQLQVEIQKAAQPGIYSLRMVSSRGVSNAYPFVVTSDPATMEVENPQLGPSGTQRVTLPAVVNGKIDEPGDVDLYAFEASEGQEMHFEVYCRPDVAAPLGGGGFDPQLTLYKSSGSWFDPARLIEIAFNDEPHSENISTFPRFSQHLSEAGLFVVAVTAFLGKGTPDYAYQLRISTLNDPTLTDNMVFSAGSGWRERDFKRKLGEEWLRDLELRTVPSPDSGTGIGKTPASSAATARTEEPVDEAMLSGESGESVKTLNRVGEMEPNDEISVPTLVETPVVIEGSVDRPGDVDTFRLRVEPGERLVFELETPRSGPPHFNPKLTVLDSEGREFLTNIYRRIGRNFTFYLKTVEPKLVDTFKLGGEYTLQIRDVTSRSGDPDFRYRLMIRSQLPHVGSIYVEEAKKRVGGTLVSRLDEHRVNLIPGKAKKLTLVTEQEEGFNGQVALTVENLPPGVKAVPGTEVEPDRGPPIDEGPKERFVPRSQKVTILLWAEEDALTTRMPRWIQIRGRPVVGGKVGAPLPIGRIPLMVIAPPVVQSEPATSKGNGS